MPTLDVSDPNTAMLESPSRTAAAERMRRHRIRQRNGLRWLAIELRETEIDALIRKGLLQQELRHDSVAVGHALYSFLDQVGLDSVTRNC